MEHKQKFASCRHLIWTSHLLMLWAALSSSSYYLLSSGAASASRRLFNTRYLCGSASRIKDTDWRRSWDGTVTYSGCSFECEQTASRDLWRRSIPHPQPPPPPRKQPCTSINRGDGLLLNHIFSALETRCSLITCKWGFILCFNTVGTDNLEWTHYFSAPMPCWVNTHIHSSPAT